MFDSFRDFFDFLKTLGVFLILALVIIASITGITVGISVHFEKQYCTTMQSLHPDREFQWVFYGGCLTQTPSGYWMSAHEYQYIEGDIR